MMYGLFVSNGFLKTDKFQNLQEFFQNSARQLNIRLKSVSSDNLLCEAADGFSCVERPDFVLFWDKDTVLARRMERAGFRLFNSAEAVEICDNKILTVMRLLGGVPVPKTVFAPKTFPNIGYTNTDFVLRAVEILGLPLVVKEAYGSFGQQVYLARTAEEAVSISNKLAGKDFLFQQFIGESSGRDIRVNVVGGKVVNAVLRRSLNGDFRSNVTLGGVMEQYELSQEEKNVAEKACRLIGLDFAGVDILQSDNGPVLCEVNSNPHFKSTFDCTGVDLSRNILQWIVQNV